MKTIPQLRKELEDAKLKYEAYKGKQEARNLQREIFKLKHPSLIKVGKRAISTGRSVSKNLRGMGKKVYEAGKSQAKQIKSEQVRKGYHSNNLFKKRKLSKGLIKYNKKHRNKKIRHSRQTRLVQRSIYNPMNPFGLDF